jgi:microcompartment protein CcmL/EutN
VSDIQSIGLIELSSVATGYQVEDVMLKAAKVQVLLARSICSGKFLIAIAGDVASVTTAVEAGGAGDQPQGPALHRHHRDIFRVEHY